MINDVVPDRNDTAKNYKNNTWWTLQMENNHKHGILEIRGTQKVVTRIFVRIKLRLILAYFLITRSSHGHA